MPVPKSSFISPNSMGGYISFSDPSHLLKSISDLRQRNLLRSISNVKRGRFLNPPHQITFSKPSQDIQGGPSQSEYLLRSFSNLPHQITFSKPSQHIPGGPSQSEYLMPDAEEATSKMEILFGWGAKIPK